MGLPCKNELRVGVYIDFQNELSKEEKKFFQWWSGFKPDIMFISNYKSPLCSGRGSSLWAPAPISKLRIAWECFNNAYLWESED